MGSSRLGLLAGCVMVAATAGCDLRDLARDDLFASGADAGAGTGGGGQGGALVGGGGAGGAGGIDAGDGPADAARDAAPDLATGVGMLSGVVSTACSPVQGLDAKVGIAGRHACSYADKGSFFFYGLPLGTLELAVAKDGYLLYQATVVVEAGGTVHNVALVPASPGGCADPPPAQVACTCPDADCPRP